MIAALLIGIVTNTTVPDPPRTILMPVEECQREAARCSRNLGALLELQEAATASIADLEERLRLRDAFATPSPAPCPEPGWTGAEVFRAVVITGAIVAVVAGTVGVYVGTQIP